MPRLGLRFFQGSRNALRELERKESLMSVIMPIIASTELEAVRKYYTESLGFREDLAMKGPDGNLSTLSFASSEGAPLMFGLPMEGGPLNPDGLMLYVSTGDVNTYHDTLAGRDGVQIAEGLTDQFWGDRTFIVRDPWGLHLMFGQTVNEMSAPPEGFEVEMAQPVS